MGDLRAEPPKVYMNKEAAQYYRPIVEGLHYAVIKILAKKLPRLRIDARLFTDNACRQLASEMADVFEEYWDQQDGD
jgi:hypothetical protein